MVLYELVRAASAGDSGPVEVLPFHSYLTSSACAAVIVLATVEEGVSPVFTFRSAASSCAGMLNSGSLDLFVPENVFLLRVWTALHSVANPETAGSRNVVVPSVIPSRYCPSTSVCLPFDFLQSE